jgi:hypothetical protein
MTDKKEDKITQTSKALGLDKVAPAIYEDLVRPTAKELGKGLSVVAKTVNAALSPLEGIVWGYEKIREHLITEVSKKIKAKNEKEICSPPLNIAGPLVEALKFTGHSIPLRDMYTNLLVSSMDVNTVATAHPSFVEIIRQLSPDEAKILKYITNIDSYPVVISDKTITKNSFQYDRIISLFRNICEKAEISYMELRVSYLDNMRRLKLLEWSHEKNHELKRAICESADQIDLIIDERNEEALYVTAFGQYFIEACVKE